MPSALQVAGCPRLTNSASQVFFSDCDRIVRGGEFGVDTNEMLVKALLYSTRGPVSCFTERGNEDKERKKGTGSRERSRWYRESNLEEMFEI